MALIGEIPMMFYFPNCGPEYSQLKKIIEDNGGLVVNKHEFHTY